MVLYQLDTFTLNDSVLYVDEEHQESFKLDSCMPNEEFAKNIINICDIKNDKNIVLIGTDEYCSPYKTAIETYTLNKYSESPYKVIIKN